MISDSQQKIRMRHMIIRFYYCLYSTNFDESTYFFDTSIVDLGAKEATLISPDALIVIKSTIPVGHTVKLQNGLKTKI